MKAWGWLFPSVAVCCMYLCRGCNAFVHLASRLLAAEQSVRHHQRLYSAYFRPPPPPPIAQSAAPKQQAAASRRPLSLSASGGEGGGVEEDPFRPERASISPMVINALVPVLFKEVGGMAEIMMLNANMVACPRGLCCCCSSTAVCKRLPHNPLHFGS